MSLLLAVIAITVPLVQTYPISLNDKAQIIASTSADYFGTRKVVYLVPGFEQTSGVVLLVKRLSAAGVLCAVIAVADLGKKGRMQGEKVILAVDAGIVIQQGSGMLKLSDNWLLFTNDENETALSRVHINYNVKLVAATRVGEGCQLTELYNTKVGWPRLTNHVGHWTPNGLQLVATGFYHRRFDFQGTTFKYLITNLDPCADTSFATGLPVMCVQLTIWLNIVEALNATAKATKSASVVPFYLAHKFSMQGFDASANGYAILSATADIVSFMWPTFVTELFIWQQYAGTAVGWDSYLKPLSSPIWTTVLSWMALTSVLIVVVTRRVTRSDHPDPWTPLVVFLSQGANEPGRRPWERILLVSLLTGPAVLFPAYSASLTSFLSVKIPTKPFTDFEGLRTQTEYKLAYFTRYYGNNLDVNPENAHVYLPKEDMPENETEGVRRMCSEKLSFINTEPSMAGIKPECSMYKLKKSHFRIIQSLTVPLDSPYKVPFTIFVRNMAYSGLLSEMRNKKMFLREILWSLHQTPADPELPPVTLDNVLVLLAMMVFVSFLSLGILLCECALFAVSKCYRSKKRGTKALRSAARAWRERRLQGRTRGGWVP